VPTVLLVDVANVVGSVPDGWWRDRAGAATRLLARLGPLVGSTVDVDGRAQRLDRVVAVVEGAARAAGDPRVPGLVVELAARDGDSAVVELAGHGRGRGHEVLVVTADRGLRARLPDGAAAVGPRWLLGLLDDRDHGQAVAVPKASPTR
jgi:hypothetical protein